MSKVEIIKRPIETISDNLKKSAWSAIVESLVTMIIGMLLIAWPDTVIQIFAYIVGVFFVVKGAYQIINYFLAKGQNDFFNNNLLYGVVSTLIGIVVLVMGQELIGIFRVIIKETCVAEFIHNCLSILFFIGVWMIYESLVRINTAIKLNTAGIIAWRYILILALIMLVLGVFITFNSGAIPQLIGWTMVMTSFIGIVGDSMFIR